jgi:hypothetical protein
VSGKGDKELRLKVKLLYCIPQYFYDILIFDSKEGVTLLPRGTPTTEHDCRRDRQFTS